MQVGPNLKIEKIKIRNSVDYSINLKYDEYTV